MDTDVGLPTGLWTIVWNNSPPCIDLSSFSLPPGYLSMKIVCVKRPQVCLGRTLIENKGREMVTRWSFNSSRFPKRNQSFMLLYPLDWQLKWKNSRNERCITLTVSDRFVASRYKAESIGPVLQGNVRASFRRKVDIQSSEVTKLPIRSFVRVFVYCFCIVSRGWLPTVNVKELACFTYRQACSGYVRKTERKNCLTRGLGYSGWLDLMKHTRADTGNWNFLY